MKRTSWLNGQTIQVETYYTVSGSPDLSCPYVHDLATLREAVQIAKEYKEHNVNPKVNYGKIKRSVTVRHPEFGSVSYMTHEWDVDKDGCIKSTGWFQDRPIKSPANQLRDSMDSKIKHQKLMKSAAIRDTTNITPDDYRDLITSILSSFIGNARKYGFSCYYYSEAESRQDYELRFATQLNRHLAYSRYRTLEDKDFINILSRMDSSDPGLIDTPLSTQNTNQINNGLACSDNTDENEKIISRERFWYEFRVMSLAAAFSVLLVWALS